jgi:hypothetical protein
MSINDKLWSLITEPVDEQIQTNSQQTPIETPAETPESNNEKPEETDGTDDEYDWVAARQNLDEDYWPYTFTPDGYTERIGPDQTKQQGILPDGSDDMFAGQWVREMFEAHDKRPDDNTWVGYTRDNVRGVQEAGIEYKSLFRHMAFFGMTGYGKSTVLKNLMVQWAFMGHGFCFIDPKGQDIRELLQLLPEDRLEDVVWVEPGNEELDSAVGFNFFDTRLDPGDTGFENEVQEIVNDFVAILREAAGGTSWGATMDSVTKSVTTQLVRNQEENYTILDMYEILGNEDERARFCERYGDGIEQVYLTRLKENYDDEDFDPLLKRIKEWAENRITREMVAHRESSINISEIVEEGKILLVNPSKVPGGATLSMVATFIVRRIWATIRTRADTRKENLDPYFIVMDEFNDLTSGQMDLDGMFSKGRSLRLSLCVANQQPTQLPDEVNEALNNCDNLFTFNPGQSNIQDAQDLSKSFGTEMMDLIDLGKFSLLGRFTVDGEKTDSILVDTFPSYPPRRTEMVGTAVKNRSIEIYGEPRLKKDFDWDSFGLQEKTTSEDGTTNRIAISDGKTVTVEQVLEAIHTAGIRNETLTIENKDGWTTVDNIREEVTKYADSITDGVALDNVLEKLPETLTEEATKSETTYYRLTAEGERKAFVQDSGQSSSAGKAGHRHLLKKGYEAFTQLGYYVTIPTQDGEMPDGVAAPPIQPMNESETFEEAEKLKSKLERKYDRLFELFGDSHVSLEAESTTITKPKQTIKNLAKAMRNDQKCAFLVKDGAESRGTFEYWARTGHRILSDPPFVSNKDIDGNRRFYNDTARGGIRLKNDGFALQKTSDKDTVWRDDGDRIVLEDPKNMVQREKDNVVYTYEYTDAGDIVLEDPDGNEYNTRFPSWSALEASGEFTETNQPLSIFKNAADLKKPSSTKFPYSYKYNKSEKEYVVKSKNGKTISTFDDKDKMLEQYDIIPKPVIPEHLFPHGGYPNEDDWQFIIIPDAGKDIGPQLYDGEDSSGESIIEPLFNGDDPYDAIKHEQADTDDPSNTTETETDTKQRPAPPTANPTPTTDDTPETNSDEVPIASTDSPKSTNDVVKNSDSVWTKPDAEDDDYDPTKDGKNYAKSHAHGNAGDWSGGEARDRDDGNMDDYQTPEEKEDDRLRQEYADKDTTTNTPDATDDPEENTDTKPPSDPLKSNALGKKRLELKKRRRERNADADETTGEAD